MGRFLNADSVISGADGSVQGKNAFAYCFNNPTNLDDSSGNWPKWIKKAASAVKKAAKVVAGAITQVKSVAKLPSTIAKLTVASAVAVVSGEASLNDIWKDTKNYSFFNTDETKVLNAKVFSSYKGTPVIKHNVPNITSFSISNTIVLNKNENIIDGGVDTIKHEWGHAVQQSLIGTGKYITRIAVPSVMSCVINPSSTTYYSLPWERSADFFGGAKRLDGYYANSGAIAGLYLILP